MTLNICLVRPRYFGPSTPYPPMGLLSLAAHFDKAHTLFWDDLQTTPVGGDGKIFYADVQVISALSNQLPLIERDIKLCKEELGKKEKFVVGGPAVTSNPEYARKVCPSADLLFAGDGEYFAENIDGYLNSGERLVDLRSTPYPLERKKLPCWNQINHQQYKLTTGFGVETSRGCPFNCVMCTAHLIQGKQWRGRKPEDVVNELTTLKQKFGCTKFYFADDNATASPSRWFELMRDISVAKLDLTLTVPEGIQAHNLDHETLVEMWLAGLRRFTIGAESGNQRVLDDVINKGGLTVEKIEWVVKSAIHLGLKPSCFFVIGFPGETLDEAKQTVEFAEKLRHLGAENCTVRNVIPMPGTRLFNIAKNEGYLTVSEDKLFDSDFVHNAKHLLKTPEWNPEDIDKLVRLAQSQERRHIVRSNLFVHPRAALKLAINRKY